MPFVFVNTFPAPHQALALAAASSRADAESEAAGRTRELEKRLLQRVHGVSGGQDKRGRASRQGGGQVEGDLRVGRHYRI